MPRLGVRPDECASGGGLPQQIRVDEPAGNQQPVVVVGVGLIQRQIDAHAHGGFVQVHPPDVAGMDRDHVHRRAGQPHRVGGNDQLDQFKPVHRQHRNPSPGQGPVSVQYFA